MKKQRFEYKQQAEQLMRGRYGVVIPVLLIFGIIRVALTALESVFSTKYAIDWETYQIVVTRIGNPPLKILIEIILVIVGSFIAFALAKLFIDIANKKSVEIEGILTSSVKVENPLRVIVFAFLQSLFILLWALLFIIPGIVKAYAYSMGFYLQNKDSSLSGMEALNKSKEITMGYKMDLFVLDLSYLGWYILGLFTLGILWFWIVPKHQTAKTLYFEEIYKVRVAPPIDGIDEDQIIYEF